MEFARRVTNSVLICKNKHGNGIARQEFEAGFADENHAFFFRALPDINLERSSSTAHTFRFSVVTQKVLSGNSTSA